MDHLHTPRSANRGTLGEALIVISVIVGFFVALMEDKIVVQDMWALAGFLVALVAFYLALLFCRMLFFWSTGGDHTPHPWWTHVEMAKKHSDA